MGMLRVALCGCVVYWLTCSSGGAWCMAFNRLIGVRFPTSSFVVCAGCSDSCGFGPCSVHVRLGVCSQMSNFGFASLWLLLWLRCWFSALLERKKKLMRKI